MKIQNYVNASIPKDFIIILKTEKTFYAKIDHKYIEPITEMVSTYQSFPQPISQTNFPNQFPQPIPHPFPQPISQTNFPTKFPKPISPTNFK